MTRLRYLVSPSDARRGPGADGGELLSVSIHRGVVPRASETDDLPRADDLANYKVVRVGDVVLNRMRAFQGAVGRSADDGIVSPDYTVLRPGPDVDSRYLNHLFRSGWFVGEMVARLRGIGSTDTGSVRTPRINWEDLSDIDVSLLSLAEQRAIADYLDAETARIDALISKKQQLIHLLEERWAATLAESFGRSTGIRLKHILAVPMAYGVLVPDHAQDGPMMLRISDFRHGHPDPASVARISETVHQQYRRTIVREGDLVVSVVGTLGRATIVPQQFAGANLNRALARLQLCPDVPTELIRMWCGSSVFARQAHLATGSDSAQPTLNLGDLANFTLGLPTVASEWVRVLHSLRVEEERHSQTRDAVASQIDLLTDRRKALIGAAVCGQL